MRHFTLGLILGSLLTGGLVSAATFYDNQGHPNAPSGSIQQYDYFRMRQFFLDQSAMRKMQEQQMQRSSANPCAK